jgi:hypothetical protein
MFGTLGDKDGPFHLRGRLNDPPGVQLGQVAVVMLFAAIGTSLLAMTPCGTSAQQGLPKWVRAKHVDGAQVTTLNKGQHPRPR